MTAPRFLIDENLSPKLAGTAHNRGFEASHVVHLGLSGATDWALMVVLRENDYTLVTNNVVEFRQRYLKEELHSGVVNLLPQVRSSQQIELFEAVLDEVVQDPDLVNTAIDVDYDGNDIVVRRTRLP